MLNASPEEPEVPPNPTLNVPTLKPNAEVNSQVPEFALETPDVPDEPSAPAVPLVPDEPSAPLEPEVPDVPLAPGAPEFITCQLV